MSEYDIFDDLADLHTPPPPSTNPLNMSSNTSSSSSSTSTSTNQGGSSSSSSSTNQNASGIGQPKDAETSLCQSLEIIYDILNSQNALIRASSSRFTSFADQTTDKLTVLSERIEDFKKQKEKSKAEMKAYIDSKVEEGIRKVSSSVKMKSQNSGRSPEKVIATAKAKGRPKTEVKEKSKSRALERELESLSYDFFSLAKTESQSSVSNQPRSGSKRESRSMSDTSSQIPNLPSTSGNTRKSISTTSEAQSNRSSETLISNIDQQIIDLTASDDDDSLQEFTPIQIENSIPTPPISKLFSKSSQKSTYTEAKTTMSPPIVSSDTSTRSRTLMPSSPTSISTDSLNRGPKRSLTMMQDPGISLGGVVGKLGPAPSIIGKKQNGILPSGRKSSLYLVLKSDQPVSAATWQKKEDIDRFADHFFNWEQNCTHEQIDSRKEVVLLPQARMFWDNKGERRDLFHDDQSGRSRRDDENDKLLVRLF